MQDRKGRKALIVVSDWSDLGTRLGLESVLEAAEESSTILYPVRLTEHVTIAWAGRSEEATDDMLRKLAAPRRTKSRCGCRPSTGGSAGADPARAARTVPGSGYTPAWERRAPMRTGESRWLSTPPACKCGHGRVTTAARSPGRQRNKLPGSSRWNAKRRRPATGTSALSGRRRLRARSALCLAPLVRVQACSAAWRACCHSPKKARRARRTPRPHGLWRK